MNASCATCVGRVLAAWLLVGCIGMHAQEYTTIVRNVRVNGTEVSPRKWKEHFTIRSEDYVEITVGTRSTAGDTIDASGYILDLQSKGMNHQRFQTESVIQYKGLSHGEYSLRIQAQVSPGVTAAPVLVRFSVGSELDIGATDASVTSNSSEMTTAVPLAQKFPVRLWIVLALTTSIVALVLAILYLKHRRRTKLDLLQSTSLGQELERVQKHSAELQKHNEQLEYELSELRVRFERATTKLEQHNKSLAQQNQHLRHQVERLRAAKRQLEQLQQEKDALLGMIIHDIKNPLLVIEQLVRLLRNYDSNSADMQQLLNDLVETTSRVVALSQQVSRLLSIERHNGLHLEIQSVDLADILRSVIHRNSYLARQKNIEILQQLPERMTADCDPQRMEEVFDNVLSNAIKYSHPESVVVVRAHSSGDHYTIEFEDHGVGMSNDDLLHLFEPGAPRSNTPTAGEPSSGLGMWIVRRLIERHGGTISVRSTKGEGTVVSITIPMRYQAAVTAH
ncbi:MAG: HAMP domain-containing histidine kinase [Chlorobi bacterium]|nr:HAMP domain-containing histidine kinase [Chlorobiota bacterium]